MKRRTMLKRLGATGLVLATATAGTTTAQSTDDATPSDVCYGGCCSENRCVELIEETDCSTCWCDDC